MRIPAPNVIARTAHHRSSSQKDKEAKEKGILDRCCMVSRVWRDSPRIFQCTIVIRIESKNNRKRMEKQK